MKLMIVTGFLLLVAAALTLADDDHEGHGDRKKMFKKCKDKLGYSNEDIEEIKGSWKEKKGSDKGYCLFKCILTEKKMEFENGKKVNAKNVKKCDKVSEEAHQKFIKCAEEVDVKEEKDDKKCLVAKDIFACAKEAGVLPDWSQKD